MPSRPCTCRAGRAASRRGRSAPRPTGTSPRPAVSRTTRVLRTTSSSGALPATQLTARRSSAGWRAASSSAQASSTPVSTSRTTGIRGMQRPVTGRTGTAPRLAPGLRQMPRRRVRPARSSPGGTSRPGGRARTRVAPGATSCAPRAATIAPLSVHSAGRGTRSSIPAASQRSSGDRPQPGVGRDAAADEQVPDAVLPAGRHGLAGEHVDHGLLEARGHVRHRAPARRRPPRARPSAPRPSSDRRTRSRSGGAPGRAAR